MRTYIKFDPVVVDEIEDLEVFIAELISLGADPEVMAGYLFLVPDIVPWWVDYISLGESEIPRASLN